jgi:capsule polysaccharide export protein KpsE/RkpR
MQLKSKYIFIIIIIIVVLYIFIENNRYNTIKNFQKKSHSQESELVFKNGQARPCPFSDT